MSSGGSSGNVETITVESLSSDHEAEGTRMAASLVAWLDVEWMPQEVHIRMGESAKTSYVACREAGEHDVMSIMMKVADDLDRNWSEYDADAFVNAWDVGNYVSDYLTVRAGGETCGCSYKIVDPDGA